MAPSEPRDLRDRFFVFGRVNKNFACPRSSSTTLLGLLFFQFRMFLRFVAGLTRLVMLVVIAFLIQPVCAHGKLALPSRAVLGRLALFRLWTMSPFANGIVCVMG